VTDGQTDGIAVASTALSMRALRRAVKSKRHKNKMTLVKTDITQAYERVQALDDISRSVLCCHSNETCVPIENPSNCAQLEATPTISPSNIRVRAVMWECGEGQTDTLTQRQISRRLTVAHNKALNSYDNLLSYHPDSRNS